MSALFISDLHLSSSRTAIHPVFFDFLAGRARQAGVLYILGDLFDYWAGDDELGTPFNASVAEALARCSMFTTIYFLPGNRDFLIGARFAAAAGLKIIADPTLAEIDGVPTLLAHGDTLCTEDSAYQRFRAEVRSPAWIEGFLAQPLAERKRQAESLRERSESEKRFKSKTVMDVSDTAVADLLRAYGYPRLIHGHTHRAARHRHTIDGRKCERWVLGDWHATGNALACEQNTCRLQSLPLEIRD